MDKIEIVFAGLDNSGKTSIIRFLNKELALEEEYVPTPKVEKTFQTITLLGLKFNYRELGGQQLYRKEYIKRSDLYFSSISLMIYVIDIKNENRYEEALNYLNELINNLNRGSQVDINNLNIIILFHKFDPNLQDEEKFDKNVNNLKNRIIKTSNIKKLRFYKTSIHDSISLINFFSEVAIELKGKSKLIQNLLTEYCGLTFASAAMIFDNNFLIVDQRSTKERYFDIIQVVAQYFISGMEKLKARSIDTIDIVSEILFPASDSSNPNKKGIILIQKLEIETPLYLVVLSRNPKTKNRAYDYLDDLAAKLLKILKPFP